MNMLAFLILLLTDQDFFHVFFSNLDQGIQQHKDPGENGDPAYIIAILSHKR